MIKWVKITALVFALMFVAAPLMAQDKPTALIHFGGAFGAGLVIIGAAFGIGNIGAGPWRAWLGSRKWPATFRRRC